MSRLLNTRSLVLELDGGVVAGKMVKINRNYSSIKETATDEQVYNTGTILAGLQEKDMLDVKVRELSTLTK